MKILKIALAVAAVSALTAAPALARHKHHHHHRHHIHVYGPHLSTDPWLFTHNYGPPVVPGDAYAFYDGPLRALCKQSGAAYRGQDGRRHPCN